MMVQNARKKDQKKFDFTVILVLYLSKLSVPDVQMKVIPLKGTVYRFENEIEENV
jgi:hypothetical protein